MLSPMSYHKRLQHCMCRWKKKTKLIFFEYTIFNYHKCLSAYEIFLNFHHQLVQIRFLVNDDYQEFEEIIKIFDQKFLVATSA